MLLGETEHADTAPEGVQLIRAWSGSVPAYQTKWTVAVSVDPAGADEVCAHGYIESRASLQTFVVVARLVGRDAGAAAPVIMAAMTIKVKKTVTSERILVLRGEERGEDLV
jgi:hypothetical protein